VDLDDLAPTNLDFVAHVRRRREQLQVVLPLQTLPDDVHVKQSEEAAAEAESERV
jgi:hypothetical protein